MTFWPWTNYLLLRVQFYDQLFLDVFRNALSLRISNEYTFHFFLVPIQPAEFRIFSTDNAGQCRIVCGFILQADNVSWFQLERRSVNNDTVNSNVFVRNQLTGSRT